MHEYKDIDMEPNLVLRKLRYKLFGYGCGWRFVDAAFDYLVPKVVFLLIACVALYLYSHTHIAIYWK